LTLSRDLETSIIVFACMTARHYVELYAEHLEPGDTDYAEKSWPMVLRCSDDFFGEYDDLAAADQDACFALFRRAFIDDVPRQRRIKEKRRLKRNEQARLRRAKKKREAQP
jgi:hypothetical protein